MYDPKVHVGVAAVLQDDQDRVLLLKRGAKATHGAGAWGFVGGWIDWGEEPTQSAARELREEANVYVMPRFGKSVDAVANTYDEHDMHVICVFVKFSIWDATDLVNLEAEKHDALEWVPIKDLQHLELFPPLESFARRRGWVK